MCLICVEIQKETLTGENFIKNIGELIDTDPKHAEVVIAKLSQTNPEYLDKLDDELFDIFYKI